MNSRHTPGPWRVGHSVWSRERGSAIEGTVPTVRAYNDVGGCDIPVVSLGLPQEECEANARLIAAAPDLLEALELITDSHERLERERGSVVASVTSIARAAIEKAIRP
jgi:hypothetical protein